MPGGINIGAVPFFAFPYGGIVTSYIQDGFTETDTTLLSTHVPDSADPSLANPSWEGGLFDGNDVFEVDTAGHLRMTDNGDGNGRYAKIASFSPDGYIESGGTVNGINGGFMGVIFRYDSDDSSYGYAYMADAFDTYNWAVPGAAGQSAAITVAGGDTWLITVTMSSNNYTITFQTGANSATVSTDSTENDTTAVHGVFERTVFGNGSNDFWDYWVHILDTTVVISVS